MMINADARPLDQLVTDLRVAKTESAVACLAH